MRSAATAENDLERMQAWAGQSARLARAEPAGELATRLWDDARRLLGGV
jgi:nitronate monooxygenase